MAGAQELARILGVGAACQVMGLWRGAPARQQSSLRRAAFVGPRPSARGSPTPALGPGRAGDPGAARHAQQ